MNDLELFEKLAKEQKAGRPVVLATDVMAPFHGFKLICQKFGNFGSFLNFFGFSR